jgi:tetratricopeptide (TPR) repeat protein
VFWVHASSATRFEESYRNIAARLRLPGWNEPKADVLGMVYGWLSDESNSQWTMVVDNADDVTVMFAPDHGESTTTITAASTARIPSDFLPLSAHGSIVITSHSREVVERLQVYSDDMLDVKPMEIEVARALALKKLKKGGRGAEARDIDRLVKYLDCMPLAITQAAAYIEQTAPRVTVVQYITILETNESERVTLLRKDVRDPRRDRQASDSIIMTWHVTFTHLRRTRDSAARLLALMSLFDREAIPDHLLEGRYVEGVDGGQIDFEDDLATLRAYSLINVGVGGHLFDMHRLVQLSTQKWLEMHAELEGWQERYIDVFGEAFPTGDYANWTTCQALFPHVEAMERYQVTDADHLQVWARTSYNGAWYATTRGQYRLAYLMARASLTAPEETGDVNNIEILDSAEMLASVLQDQGKYEQAEAMNRRVLVGREKELGVDHPSTLTIVNNLAGVLQSQRRYEQAEAMNRRALAGREKELGVDHPNTLTSVSNLALVLQDQGKYEQAEAMNRRALAGMEKELGVDHPDTLTSVYCLVHLLSVCGERHEALELYGRARSLDITRPLVLSIRLQ